MIELIDVYKSYGKQQVLQGYSLAIQSGEAVAVMGPSGAGKTTLIRLIMGLEAPDSGRIERGGELRFCCVFQQDRLCEGMSAFGNVALVLPRARFGEVAPALAELGLDKALIQKSVQSLSGGERRRTALARAVLAKGDYIVLDEPFKGLDEQSRAQAVSFIQKHKGERGLLLVTHSEQDAITLGAKVVQLEKVHQSERSENEE